MYLLKDKENIRKITEDIVVYYEQVFASGHSIDEGSSPTPLTLLSLSLIRNSAKRKQEVSNSPEDNIDDCVDP
ncbi:uncharacterized protein DS421_5g164100 [Arachis hypogaea]|nr:uncharacterized protein DS421_5g164100 [Arachis hypogaea]